MTKCIRTSKKHGHGAKPCGKPTTGDFCDDCSSRMVTDEFSGTEALKSAQSPGRCNGAAAPWKNPPEAREGK